MAIYTNTMRLTGLSGIDTESMVTALMKAEGMKLDKLKQQNQLTLWKQTAYYNIADAFRTFQNSFLALSSANSARLSSTYLRNAVAVKTSSGADSAAVRVTNSSNAETGKYTIDVKQLATKDTYAGASDSAKVSITSAGKDWSDPSAFQNLRDGDGFTLSLDGMSKTITFSKDDITSLNGGADFKKMLQDKLDIAFGKEYDGASSKVIANIDSGGALSIAASKGHTVVMRGAAARDTAVHATSAENVKDLLESVLKLSDFGPDGNKFTLNINENDTDKPIEFTLNSGMSAADVAAAVNKGIAEADTKIESGLKAFVDSNGKITFGVGNTTNVVTVSDESGASVFAGLGFGEVNSLEIKPTNVLNDFGFTAGSSTKMDVTRTLSQAFGSSGTVSFSINGRDFSFDAESATVQDVINKVNSANIGAKLSLDTLNENFKLESANTGTANALTIVDTGRFLGAKGLKLAETEVSPTVFKLSQSADQKAKDSQFIFNGVETTRDSNSIDISGIRMELTQVTSSGGNPVNGGPVTITLEKDLSGTLDVVKNFVNAYNTMIDSLNKAMNTNRPKRDSYNYYQPLTEDQKSAMKDTDITNWETQAQTGLLYNDDLLRGISSSLRGMLYQPVTLSNGTKFSLYEIGITTSNNLSDNGKLVIDENKLSQALTARAGDIAELFTKTSDIAYKPGVTDRNRIAREGIAERMNDIINNAIGSSGAITKRAGMKGDTLLEMSSTMYKTMKDQNNRIAEMLVYLRNKENDYYSMFSRMEQAISNSNNQMAYLQSQLGILG